jgi:hypothetical protein
MARQNYMETEMTDSKTPHPAVVTEIPFDCPGCGGWHPGEVLERTGGKCPAPTPHKTRKKSVKQGTTVNTAGVHPVIPDMSSKTNRRTRNIRRAVVSINDSPGVDCWLDPHDRWNGWACPFFTREQLPALFAMIETDGEMKGRLDDDGVVRIVSADYGEDEPEDYEATVVDEVEMWAVGAWAWVWQIDSMGIACPDCGAVPDEPYVGHHSCPSCGRTFTIAVGAEGARGYLTEVECPGCTQRIYRRADGSTECGGEDDGTCAAANYAHDAARGISDPEWLADEHGFANNCEPPTPGECEAILAAHREISDGDALPGPATAEPSEATTQTQRYVNAVKDFSRAGDHLLREWDRLQNVVPGSEEAPAEYPFGEDFTETCLKISAWAEAVEKQYGKVSR